MEAAATFAVGVLTLVVGAGVLRAVNEFSRRARRKYGSPPVRCDFHASEVYAGDTGIIAMVPTDQLRNYGRGEPEWSVTVRTRGAFVAGTPFVISVVNTSDPGTPTRVRVVDAEIRLRDYWPFKVVARHKSVVQSSVIQAGGRGSEAAFSIRLNTTDPIVVPLFTTLGVEHPRAARGLSLAAGQRCEVAVSILPAVDGRYTFDFSVTVSSDGLNRRYEVATGIPLVMCQDLSWAERYVRTFVWTNPTVLDTADLDPLWQHWRELMIAPGEGHDPTRRVEVSGFVEPTAYE